MSFSSNDAGLINQIPQTINLPKISDPDLFQERLEDLLRNIANNSNGKTGGLYTLKENFSSEQYYRENDPNSFRNVYRKTIDFVQENGGSIGPSVSVSFPHGISQVEEAAMIYANCTATDGRRFTCVFPDVWIDGSDAHFVNPVAENLSQCDVVIGVLKET